MDTNIKCMWISCKIQVCANYNYTNIIIYNIYIYIYMDTSLISIFHLHLHDGDMPQPYLLFQTQNTSKINPSLKMTAGPFEASWQIPLLSRWPLQKYFQLMAFLCEVLMWGRFCHQQNHPQKNQSWSSTPPKFETPALLERVMLVQWIWSKKTVQFHCQSIFLTKFLNLEMLLVCLVFLWTAFLWMKKQLRIFPLCQSVFSFWDIISETKMHNYFIFLANKHSRLELYFPERK